MSNNLRGSKRVSAYLAERGIEARVVPLKEETFDDGAMLAAMDQNTKILFVCNPNNPTGTYWSKDRLMASNDYEVNLRAELEILEMTLDSHPFALFADVLERVRRLRPVVVSDELRRYEGREVYLLGWKVTAKRAMTVNDEPMCFVTFCDERGRFEASFFPEVYERCALELVRGMGPYLVKGKVELAFGVAEVVASHVKFLATPGAS